MDPNEVVAELQATLAHMRGEITFLRDQFATATAAVNAATTTANTSTPASALSRPKPSPPHPDNFAGDASKYDN
jgi:hypothetical protein